MKAIGAAVIAVSTAVVAMLSSALGLPAWTPLAFLLSFPLYWLALERVAAARLKRWEQDTRARAEKGDVPPSAAAGLPESAVLRWYHPRAELFERAARPFGERSRWREAVMFLEAAHRAAKPEDRPRLAREIWAAKKKTRSEGKPDFGPYLGEALSAPNPPYDLYEDYAEQLMERGRWADADQQYRRALALAQKDSQRFKLCCRLAVACVRDGRFGAAEGMLHDAHELMPAGDPGFEALYERTREEIASAKADAKSDRLKIIDA